MAWQYNPYAVPLLVAAGVLFSFTLFIARRRSGIALTLFMLFMLGIVGLCVTYALELLSAALPNILFWVRIEYLFNQSVPLLWLLFVIAYTRRAAWITRRKVLALSIIPALQVIAAATNDYHHLHWITVGTSELNGLVLFARTYGPSFWLGSAYLYALLTASLILLVVAIRQAPKTIRSQLIPLLIGAQFPPIAGLVAITPFNPVPGLDLFVFGLVLTCVPIGWSLFRFRLFDLVPAAYDLIISSMSDAVIVLDARDQVLDVNPAAARLIGLPASEIVGRFAQHLFANSQLDMLSLLLSWETTGEISAEMNGSTAYFDVRISPLRDYRHEYTGRVLVLRNNTAQKEAEDTIRRYAAELEERNRDLDSFSDTVAHDLRAPLHLVIGYVGMLLDFDRESLEPGVLKYLTEVQGAGYKMNEMVQSLLVLARLRDVQKAVIRIPIGPIVRAAAARFQDRVRMRGITIEIDPDLPEALGHTTWVEEVFANLIGNAINYIGPENAAPRIQISGRTAGSMVRYEVRDNGLGIHPEAQAQIFEAFKRFHPEMEKSGLGMGLAIVHRIVTRLGGKVGVESEVGKGSTFWFTLPRIEDDAADEA